jgi:hypothetical protein
MLFTNFFVSPSGAEGSDKGEPEEEVAKPNPPNPILGTSGRDKALLTTATSGKEIQYDNECGAVN